MPYFKEQIDNNYQRLDAFSDFNIEQLPSEYVEQHVHFTWVTDTFGIENRHIDRRRAHAVVERLPARQPNYPNAWSATQASMSRVPLPEKHLMLVGNTKRLYGFGND